MIKIENLNKIFNENTKREFHALKNINLEIQEGEFVAVIGKNGSRKINIV